MMSFARLRCLRVPIPQMIKRRASTDGGSKTVDGFQPESSKNPLPSFVNVIVNANEQPTSGRAFSLVELLAVVGIIALVSVAAVPVMRGLGGSQSSRATAQILVSALEQARTAAILSGTNVYLVLLKPTNSSAWPHSYGIVRPPVDQDGDLRDDFQTNVASSNWVSLSKWERLPGDLVFSTNRLALLPAFVRPTGLVIPPETTLLPHGIGFAPSGGLMEDAATNGLWFASSNKLTNNANQFIALVADRIEISFYSGRVRYAGFTNRVDPF